MKLFLVFSLSFVLLSCLFAQQDPLEDRARAYQDKGTLKLATGNFGRFIGIASPEALWGDFQYVPDLSFVLGIPGKDANGQPYPWAMGQKQIFDVRTHEFYYLGDDTTYWGPTVSESWFDRTPNLERTDWEAVENSRINLFNPKATAGNYYGKYGRYTSSDDPSPLIATSTIPDTWPLIDSTHVWPGHWAIDPTEPTGQKEIEGQFVSDQDIYFQIDDRLATRDVDPYQGYPTHIMVEVSSYSFADTLVRDMVFFNLILHNQSTYDYSGVYVGLYFDADIYHRLENGSYLGRTNDDDMANYDLKNNFAYIYDLDGDHDNYYVGDKKLAYCGIKFLDTPVAEKDLDLDMDGQVDVKTGDKLGLTSWHWFDWYYRPGARDVNPLTGPYSGDGETPVAANKEEIQYKILAGDTSHLTIYDSTYYFHPLVLSDSSLQLNPYFDSDDQLLKDYPEGLDCVFIMATGPFSLKAGDSTTFSFCLIMAQDENQFKQRAQHAQVIYENHYRLVPTSLRSQEPGQEIARNFKLFQNYPNPFNPTTTISYLLPEQSHVQLAIYNLAGEKVCSLIQETQNAGQHQVVWDGRNDQGQLVSSGLYFYRLQALTPSGARFTELKKMIFVR